ncbi:hypothetical protein BJ742DRAFT_772949 [Cladochytrium replicatum]|nr:hypothetical protein BJ742DRAFT_772949 [Cladochytrium replicatum]
MSSTTNQSGTNSDPVDLKGKSKRDGKINQIYIKLDAGLGQGCELAGTGRDDQGSFTVEGYLGIRMEDKALFSMTCQRQRGDGRTTKEFYQGALNYKTGMISGKWMVGEANDDFQLEQVVATCDSCKDALTNSTRVVCTHCTKAKRDGDSHDLCQKCLKTHNQKHKGVPAMLMTAGMTVLGGTVLASWTFTGRDIIMALQDGYISTAEIGEISAAIGTSAMVTLFPPLGVANIGYNVGQAAASGDISQINDSMAENASELTKSCMPTDTLEPIADVPESGGSLMEGLMEVFSFF